MWRWRKAERFDQLVDGGEDRSVVVATSLSASLAVGLCLSFRTLDFGPQIVTFGRFFLEPGSMSRAQLALIKRTALIHGIAANDRGADAAAADRARRRVAAYEQVDLLSHC